MLRFIQCENLAGNQALFFFFFFFKDFFIYLFIYLFIYGCVGSSFLCEGFLQLRQAGATLHRGARASHHRGPSRHGAQAPDAQAQQLWLTGPAAPWHVGSSQARARTRVPCISRQTLNHCATREAPSSLLTCSFILFIYLKKYLFIWLRQVLVAAHGIFVAPRGIFIAVCGIFSCGMQDLVGSSSLTGARTRAPCIGSAESYPLDHQGSP